LRVEFGPAVGGPLGVETGVEKNQLVRVDHGVRVPAQTRAGWCPAISPPSGLRVGERTGPFRHVPALSCWCYWW
jgi:hypothetical protein